MMRTPTLLNAVLLGAFQALSQPADSNVSPDELLLRDYRPQSIYRVPQTTPQQARFPVVDVHSHDYANSVDQVVEWVGVMDGLNLEKTIILSGASGERFDAILARFGKHRGRFSVWCGLDLAGWDQPGYGPAAVAELERCWRAGAEGVGELIDKGRGLRNTAAGGSLQLDDPRLAPLFEKCGELGLPVNVHVGEDQWMYEPMDRRNDGLMNAFKWRIPEEPGVLRHEEVIAMLERLVQRHPRTTFIACHLANCCHDLSILGRLLDAHGNLHADIGARFGETAPIPRYMAAFYRRYQDRLLYGTDMGRDPAMYRTTFRILETEDEHFYDWRLFSYHWPLHGFGLEDGILRKVYGENARALLRNVKRP